MYCVTGSEHGEGRGFVTGVDTWRKLLGIRESPALRRHGRAIAPDYTRDAYQSADRSHDSWHGISPNTSWSSVTRRLARVRALVVQRRGKHGDEQCNQHGNNEKSVDECHCTGVGVRHNL